MIHWMTQLAQPGLVCDSMAGTISSEMSAYTSIRIVYEFSDLSLQERATSPVMPPWGRQFTRLQVGQNRIRRDSS